MAIFPPLSEVIIPRKELLNIQFSTDMINSAPFRSTPGARNDSWRSVCTSGPLFAVISVRDYTTQAIIKGMLDIYPAKYGLHSLLFPYNYDPKTRGICEFSAISLGKMIEWG